MSNKTRKLGPVGKLKRLCKEKGTSITKLAKVADVPLSSLTQLWDNDMAGIPLKYSEKLRKCLQLTSEEWLKIIGLDWEPSAESLEYLTTDMRRKESNK